MYHVLQMSQIVSDVKKKKKQKPKKEIDCSRVVALWGHFKSFLFV